MAVPQFVAMVLALAQFAAPSIAQSPAPASAPAKYELPAIPDEFKDADAVILSWDQKWTVAPDGSITQHETKRVLIKHDRAVGAFADPRITYNKEWQTVNVLVARTLTPDGRVLDVPEYSRNTVAPGESAGWPAFAAIQQIVLTYSAVEPGAILELEWERATKPGMKHGTARVVSPSAVDLQITERISSDYPTLERTIRIPGTDKRWVNVAADRDEAQSIPSIERNEYYCCHSDIETPNFQPPAKHLEVIDLRFSDDARKQIVAALKKWCEGRLSAQAKAREIHSQFSKYFNVVGVNETFVPDPVRLLDKIYESRYGSHREAAALLLGLFREAGLDVQPYFIAGFHGKNAKERCLISYGTVLKDGDQYSYWTAEQGRLRNPRSSPTQHLVTREGPFEVANALTWDTPSAVSITGNVTIASDHKWTGQIDLHCTGVFCDAPALRTEDERKNFAREIIERVLPKCVVESTSISSLSDDEVRLGAKIKTEEPLSVADGHRLLQLAAHGPHGRSIGIPISTSIRRTDLRLASRFDENIALTIELPKDVTLVSMPRGVDKKGPWGAVRQTATRADNRLSFERHVTIGKRDIPSTEYASMRDALSDIQTDTARTFIWKTPADDAKKVN